MIWKDFFLIINYKIFPKTNLNLLMKLSNRYYVYDGDFFDGVMSGKGIIEYSDGSSYEGSFKDGLFEGEGKFIYANGKQKTGIYKNGYLEEKPKSIN